MIEELAIVTEVDGHRVSVASEIKSTCHQCSQKESCANGQIAQAIPHKTLSLTVSSQIEVSVGDKVVIGLPDIDLLAAARMTYLLPLFGLFIGALLGNWLVEDNELLAIVLAATFAVVGFTYAKYRLKQFSANNAQWLEPKIVRKACEIIPVTEI